jgi:hypothetical protein
VVLLCCFFVCGITYSNPPPVLVAHSSPWILREPADWDASGCQNCVLPCFLYRCEVANKRLCVTLVETARILSGLTGFSKDLAGFVTAIAVLNNKKKGAC